MIALVLLTVAAVAAVAGHDQLLRWRHRRHCAGARWVTVAAPPEVDAESAAALWTTMAGVLAPARRWWWLRGHPHVGWEYTWTGRSLTIRLWVPGTVADGAVEAAVTAAWPGCTLTTADAGPPIPDLADQDGGALWPQHPDTLPLRTEHHNDPLRALLAAGAAIRSREHACLQVLARPAPTRRVAAARRAAATGARPDAAAIALNAAVTVAVTPLLWLVELFNPPARPARPEARAIRRDPIADAHHRAAVVKAVNVPHFEIAVRYAVAADPRPDRTQEQRHRLAAVAHTIYAAAATYTRPNRLRRIPTRRPVAVLAGRRLRRGFLATVEELAALAAIPRDVAVPGLDRARAKAVPAPVAVPSGGRSVKVLGRSQVGGHSVGLHVVDSRQHVHLVGKTGVGKSTLLLNMILADVHARRGTVVIDPRGDLVTDILDRLPATYADRIAIIDPDQPNPACFNPLDDTGDAHLAVDNLVGIFAKIFQRHWGPRIDDTLRVSCLTLMRHANPTLSLVPPLLNDHGFRARFTHDLTDPEGLGGFWQWYDSMNDGLRAQVIGPVLARLRAFLLRDFVKDVIGTARSSFQMADILDGGLLLCRLPKGILGEETARILGSLIVARTWQAAIARATQPETARRDATIYIDECQNFLTLPGSVDDMLAEARGFRLGLVLAHQNLAQLPKETQAAVSANARTKIYFTVDPSDAKDLAIHTRPDIDEHDLAHLDVHTAAARLLVGNRELPAFTFTTNPPAPPVGEATAIRQACAAAHARSGEPAIQRAARRSMGRRR
ncbi:type IV secretion system coupling TraD/TrwB family protein [Micromonospora kangleipakensis]|uniref:Type IV secretion system coupling TraD/TrwB family protein n=1 Tax=Micromonospora kangleipakensis TaxID=1077942 RepID=A0A4Q8BFS5_9ACTN|nr:type IV secretion system DNA-binding domain-containing protein [Micromonospora kangleipakensis]RZU76039.1 type IV secretion system coupling TraD/TrwB family protein [Micromonospora kangleipakensis]